MQVRVTRGRNALGSEAPNLCQECGAPPNPNSNYCQRCGKPVTGIIQAPPPRSTTNPSGVHSDFVRHYHVRGLLLVLSLLLIGFSPASTPATTASATADSTVNGMASVPSRFDSWSAWRGYVAKTPTPAAGCFVATYPSTVWQPTQCVPPPEEHSLPSTASQSSTILQPSTVGNGNDWMVQAPSDTLISSSFGNFSVYGLTGEKDVCVAPFLQQCGSANGGHGVDWYSIQDNTNSGFPVNYHGKTTTGWEQFLYANSGSSGVVYIEYWLFNYGTCPPASQDPPGGGVGWFSSGANCVFNTYGTPTPFEPATNLSKLNLQSYADFAGNDEAMLCVDGGSCYATSVTGTVLRLYEQWTDSEFNVFGYDNGAQAQFNSGTTITVGNILFDHNANSIRTTCVSPLAYTGETNNLNLVSCSTRLTGSLSSMTFTETNAPVFDFTVASSPLGSLYVTGSGFVIVDGVGVTTPDTFSWIQGSTHSIAAVSPVSCGTQCRYVFIGWSDQGAQSHDITIPASSNATGLFFPTYTAAYQKQYYPTIQTNGPGYVALSSEWCNAGSKITLIATANPHDAFKSWTGTGSGSYTGTNNLTTITINGPIIEFANFG